HHAASARMGRWSRGRRPVFAERVLATPWRLVPVAANGQPAFACYEGELVPAGRGQRAEPARRPDLVDCRLRRPPTVSPLPGPHGIFSAGPMNPASRVSLIG